MNNTPYIYSLKRMYEWDVARTKPTGIIESRRMAWLKDEVSELYDAAQDLAMATGKQQNVKTSVGVPLHYNAAIVANVIKESFDVMKIAMGGLFELGLSYEQIEQLLHLCCDSNDTRPQRILKPGEKGEKGVSFEPAEPHIIKFLLENEL